MPLIHYIVDITSRRSVCGRDDVDSGSNHLSNVTCQDCLKKLGG